MLLHTVKRLQSNFITYTHYPTTERSKKYFSVYLHLMIIIVKFYTSSIVLFLHTLNFCQVTISLLSGLHFNLFGAGSRLLYEENWFLSVAYFGILCHLWDDPEYESWHKVVTINSTSACAVIVFLTRRTNRTSAPDKQLK